MEEASYYLSFSITFVLCVISMLFIKQKTASNIWSEQKGKNIYSGITLIIGVCGGTLIFHGLVWFFTLLGVETSFGHAGILVAAVVYDFILGLVLIVIGRIIIGWKEFTW